jgi:hypothetical protein
MDTITGTISLAVGSIGTLLFLIGTSMDQSASNKMMAQMVKEAGSGFTPPPMSNPLGLTWYLLILSMAVYGGVAAARFRGMATLGKYRGLFMGLLAVCLASLPEELNAGLKGLNGMNMTQAMMVKAKHVDPQLAMEMIAMRLTVSGIVVTIIPMFVLLALLGTESEAWFNGSSRKNSKV